MVACMVFHIVVFFSDQLVLLHIVKKILLILLLIVTFSFGFSSRVLTQERRSIQKIGSEIIFDGMPDDAAWDAIDTFPLISHNPTFGLPTSERSVVKMAYDDSYIYVGALLYASQPDYIQAAGKKRDMVTLTSDFFGISIDSYNDKENSLMFFTNPLGLRWDATVMNDATPVMDSEPMNPSWNTFWDVKTLMDDKGWYMEMRIPISSLRFQDEEGITVMGISFFRWIPALNEGDVYPAISNEWGRYSNMKPSLFAEVEFEGLRPKKPLYISPYLLTGFEQSNELNEAETAYEYMQDYKLEPGLDIKYGINPNTTLDLTLNTDFAQVEADDQQFNLTRFSLVFPEKRQFFLERSSIFDFGLGGPNNLFYSRRIGLHEGNPVRVFGGARLNARFGDWDIGLMDLQTASFEEMPSENFGVFRAKKRIINEYSYTGGMITSRLGVDGSYNVAYGLDGVVRVFGDDYLTLRWAQTFKDSSENNPLSMDPTRFMISWERRKQKGFTYSLLFTYSGTEFEPGIGLEVFDDYFASEEDLRYNWISPEASKLQNHYISILNYHLNDLKDGSLLIHNLSPGWFFNAKNGWMGSFNLILQTENLQEEFEILDPVLVPVGHYRFLNTNLMLITPMSRSLYTIFTFEGGGFYDGIRISPSLEPSWVLGASVELGGMYRYDYVSFPDRNQELRNHIAGLKALYMLNTKISLSAYIQYNTAINKVISNIRFRYNPKEGTDLYIVFNEGRNTLLERELPHLPAYDERNITLKFTYTFELQR